MKQVKYIVIYAEIKAIVVFIQDVFLIQLKALTVKTTR